VQNNPQVIDSPFDETPVLGTITKVTRSNFGLLEHCLPCLAPWLATQSDNSTRARKLISAEHALLRRKQRRLANRKDIENGADHLP
jgi:hypothetical protein